MDKLALIKRNTKEIIGEDELRELLKKKKRPVVYLGTAITRSPHIGYFFWVMKLADFLKAGFKVRVLLADLHGALDNTPWDILERRYVYYRRVIPLMFESVGVDVKDIEIVKGSDFQLGKDYFYDVLRLSTFVSAKACMKAASDIVKFAENPRLSGLIYPVMQVIDEEYLGVDVQLGGLDQRKIFVFARENLGKIGYKRRVEVMLPMLPGLSGGKMSASVERSKIDLLDNEKIVKEKVDGAYCPKGDVNNGIMTFLRYVIMVLKEDNKDEFKVERKERYGGDLVFRSYKEVERIFKKKELHPQDLKNAVAREINELLLPVRKDYKNLKKLYDKAF